MRRQLLVLALVLASLALVTAPALAEDPLGKSAPSSPGRGTQADRSFGVQLIAASRDIRVLYLRPLLDGVPADPTATSFLVIQGGDAAFLQPLNGSLIGAESCWVDSVNAAIVDLGTEPGVIATISGGESPDVGYTVARVYGVSGDSVEPLGDVQILANQELTTMLAAGGRAANTPWRSVRIAAAAAADTPAPAVQRVFYFDRDALGGKYRLEDYTLQFERQVVVEDDAAVPTTFLYFHLNHDGVRLREGPSAQARILQTLPLSSTFEILDRTDDVQTVRGVTERWYKVLLKDGQGEGWIFGGSIRRSAPTPSAG